MLLRSGPRRLQQAMRCRRAPRGCRAQRAPGCSGPSTGSDGAGASVTHAGTHHHHRRRRRVHEACRIPRAGRHCPATQRRSARRGRRRPRTWPHPVPPHRTRTGQRLAKQQVLWTACQANRTATGRPWVWRWRCPAGCPTRQGGRGGCPHSYPQATRGPPRCARWRGCRSRSRGEANQRARRRHQHHRPHHRHHRHRRHHRHPPRRHQTPRPQQGPCSAPPPSRGSSPPAAAPQPPPRARPPPPPRRPPQAQPPAAAQAPTRHPAFQPWAGPVSLALVAWAARQGVGCPTGDPQACRARRWGT